MILKQVAALEKKTQRIIDLGCGPGFTIAAVAEKFPRCEFIGIDFSTEAITEAKNRMPNHQWLEADATSAINIAPADLVVCTEVIEHVDNPKDLAANLIELCRPGGSLVLTTQAGHVHATERAVGHLRHFSATQLREILESAGWVSVMVTRWGWPGYWLLKKLANVNAKSTLKHLGDGDYSSLARLANATAYYLTWILSFSTSRWGTQLVVTALKPERV